MKIVIFFRDKHNQDFIHTNKTCIRFTIEVDREVLGKVVVFFSFGSHFS